MGGALNRPRRQRRRRGRRQLTPAASQEVDRLRPLLERLLLEETSARGPVTPETLQATYTELSRRVRRRCRFVPSATWDALTGVGMLGDGAVALFGAAHPTAVPTLTWFSISTVVAAAGIVGKWLSSSRKATDSTDEAGN